MSLDGSACSGCLPVVTCDFNPPDHVPRTSPWAQTCAAVFGRAPCVPRSRKHEQRLRTEEKKYRCAKESNLLKTIQGSPSACVKGHEGNTEVFKAYLCGRKHGQRNSRGASADYYPLSKSPVAIALATMVYFEYYYPRTAVVRR